MSGASATRSGGYTLAAHGSSHSQGGYDALGVENLPLALVDAPGKAVPQEGISSITDGALSINSTTSVRVAAGSAWIDGDNVVGAGRYFVSWPQTDINIPLAADANDRLDLIIVRLQGKHGVTPTVERVAGTAGQASQVTLDNRLGAVALPNAALHVADVVSDNVNGVTTTSVRDKRPWASIAPAPVFPFRTATGLMATFKPHSALVVTQIEISVINDVQNAALMYFPTPIAGLTKLRYALQSDRAGSTVMAIYHPTTGALLASTPTVPAADDAPVLTLSPTLDLTAGWYWVMYGQTGLAGGTRHTGHCARAAGTAAGTDPNIPNTFLRRTTAGGQGAVLPADLSAFTDTGPPTYTTNNWVPVPTLSVS